MSKLAKMALQQALTRMQMQPVMVEPSAVPGIVRAAQSMMANEDIPDDMTEDMLINKFDELCQTYGYSGSTRGKNFAFADGTAIIPVHGTLINRYGGYYYGEATGYNFIRRQRAEAMADPDVERIVYDVNSGGGEAAGCFELSDESFELRGQKPTLAVVDSNCYSAAYAFASSADKISVTPSGGAGSIGVISMHTDISKLLDDYGVKITLITAGEHKADGNPFSELSPEVKANIQASVDATRDKFVALVARNRGIDEKAVRDTEARCYNASDALALNLIDAVETPTQAINAFINGPSGSTTGDDTSMTTQTTAPDGNANLSTPAGDPAKMERERIAGIMNCEAAQGKSKLAGHLAFNTDLSVEAATQILSAAAPEATAQAPAPTAPEANTTVTTAALEVTTNGQHAETNFFRQAMDNSKHPEVGANAPGGDAEEVDELMASYSMASGEKF